VLVVVLGRDELAWERRANGPCCAGRLEHPQVRHAGAPSNRGLRGEGERRQACLTPVELIGANFSGMENTQTLAPVAAFANSTLAFWQSLKNYQGSGINTVRLQLNSAMYLGYACGQAAATYQAAVSHVVSLATQAGLYVILDLHWDAPNAICPRGQGGFATANATAFWSSLAAMFKSNPAVIFELFNEPFGNNTTTEWSNGTDQPILANGGNFSPFTAQNNVGNNNPAFITTNITYPVAGEISLLNTIRAQGATNLVLASPGYWAGSVNLWLGAYNTKGNPDKLKNFGATWHDYPGWTGGSSYALAIGAAGYPLVITETYGFDANLNAVGNFTTGGKGLSASAGYAFARAHNIGYVCGWQVNDWGGQTTLSLTATPPWSGCASQ
jgi:endoglucanase